MLRDEQKSWLEKLSNTKLVKIIPHNPQTKKIVEKQKKELQQILGKDIEILHRGANALGISGQGDIDIYIPVAVNQFDILLRKLEKAYGEPDSIYPQTRARFNRYARKTRIEIQLINEDSHDWKQHTVFWNYLISNSDALQKYEKLKAAANGKSIREYYRRKIEFINNMLEKAT